MGTIPCCDGSQRVRLISSSAMLSVGVVGSRQRGVIVTESVKRFVPASGQDRGQTIGLNVRRVDSLIHVHRSEVRVRVAALGTILANLCGSGASGRDQHSRVRGDRLLELDLRSEAFEIPMHNRHCELTTA